MKKLQILIMLIALVITGCKSEKAVQKVSMKVDAKTNKKVVYQVFTRLFGNTNTTNKPWGTISITTFKLAL